MLFYFIYSYYVAIFNIDKQNYYCLKSVLGSKTIFSVESRYNYRMAEFIPVYNWCGKKSIWKIYSLALRTGKVSPNNFLRTLMLLLKNKKLNLFLFYKTLWIEGIPLAMSMSICPRLWRELIADWSVFNSRKTVPVLQGKNLNPKINYKWICQNGKQVE